MYISQKWNAGLAEGSIKAEADWLHSDLRFSVWALRNSENTTCIKKNMLFWLCFFVVHDHLQKNMEDVFLWKIFSMQNMISNIQ